MMHNTFLIVGASRGIGFELVKQLIQNKENQVIALSRNIESLSKLSGFEGKLEIYPFDLSQNNVRESLTKILQSVPKIDFMINNAGKLVNKPFEEISSEEMLESYQVNVIGVMQAVQAVVPKMKENGGHIVNISSMGGFQGTVKFAGLSSYSTSKAAVVSFTELFAEEYKDTKIKMNCLCLGAVQTEMLAEAFPGYEAPVSPEEMAHFIVDFTQNGHRFMHGKILPVSLTTP